MGWQRQDHGPSVQQALEEALARMTGEQAQVTAAGRTDAGVHALAMSAHVDVEKELTPHRLREGLNALVRPAPISILSAEPVAGDWHARFSCTGRKYLYRILNRRSPPALDRGRVWHLAVALNLSEMQAGAARLVGRHDFTTFRSAHCQSDSPLKTLEMRYRLQSIAHDYLRNGAMELKFQDPAETNALLRRHGVTEDNIRDFTPAELARFLNVEYLLSGMVVQDYVGQQTVRHTERREYERRGRTRRQSTGVSNTRDQMSTSIDLDMYNDKGENIFSKSRRSILSDIDAYKNGIHYLLKRSPLYHR